MSKQTKQAYEVLVWVTVEADSHADAIKIVREAVNSDAFANLRTLHDTLIDQEVGQAFRAAKQPAQTDPTCVLCHTGEEPGHEH